MLTINALAAADQVIIPVQAQYLSIKGLEQLIRTIAKVRRQINPRLSIAGIVVTMADMRTNYARDIVELLHMNYDGKLRIFDSIIPLSVRAAETSAEGKSINDLIRRRKRIDSQHTKRRHTIQNDRIIFPTHRIQVLSQDCLPAHGVDQGNLHAGQFNVCREQVNTLRMVENPASRRKRLFRGYPAQGLTVRVREAV